MASSDDITTSQGLAAGSRPDTAFFQPSNSEPTHPTETAAPSTLPTHIASYEIGEEIARGGMGIVFRGRDRELNRELAFKVLLCTPGERPDLVRRFLDEARITGQLQHPGVVPIHQIGALTDGRPFFAMKLVQGRTLAQRLAEIQKRDPEQGLKAALPELLPIFEQICQTVAFAHSKGVVHRDLKPSNVMVGAFGEVQVMDWGLAKVLGSPASSDACLLPESASAVATANNEEATRAGMVLGTALYMAPEQARGEIERHGPRSDVFALGAMLCEMLTGKPPYQGSRSAVQLQAIAGDMALAFERLDQCGADADLVTLAKHCLSPDPDQRPADASAVAAAITGYQTTVRQRLHDAEIAQARTQAEALAARKRRRLVLAFASLVVLFGVAAALWQMNLTQEARLRASRLTSDAVAEREAAAQLWEKARRAGEDDLVSWAEALGAAEKARLAAEQPEVEEAIRAGILEQYRQIQEEKEQAREKSVQKALDRRTRDALEKLPSRLQRYYTPSGWDQAGIAREFDEIYRKGYGIDLKKPAEAVRRIQSSAIRNELLVGLEWSLPMRSSIDEAIALADLIERIDPDPKRRDLRLAFARNDRLTIRQLARKGVADLPPVDRINLAQTLAFSLLFSDVIDLLAPMHLERPSDYPINLLLAQAYYRNEPPDFALAEKHGWMAIAVRPSEPGGWTHLHAALITQKKYLEANDVLLAALANEKDDAQLGDLLRLHQTLVGIGKEEVAFASAEKAVALAPDLARTQYGLALMWLVRKQPDTAYRITRAFLDRKPDDLDARMTHGSICWRTGRLPEGSDTLAAALAQDPQQFALKWHGLRLTQQADRMIRICEQYLERHPPSLAVFTVLGWSQEMAQRPAEAIETYRRALEMAPLDKLMNERLGRLLVGTGRLEEALQQASRWLESQSPPPQGAHLLRAQIYQDMGRLEEALSDIRREREMDPTNETARKSMTDLLLDYHRPEEALVHLKEDVKTPPSLARNWGNLGRALRHTEDLDGAIQAFEKALHYGGPFWLDRAFVQKHIEITRTMARIQGDLPDILAGTKKPATAQDALTLGKLLHLKREFAASTKLYQQALELNPRLMEDRDLQFGYEAACSATLAVTPLAKDQPVEETQRVALRKQALDWMRAECACYEKLAAGNYRDRTKVVNVLRRWKSDPDLAPIRGTAILKLPETERGEFAQFWAEVDRLLAQSH